MYRSTEDFGSKLRSLRRALGETQRQAAQGITASNPEFEISQTSISHLERRVDAPRQEILNILAEYYGVPVGYFYRDTADQYATRKPHIQEYLSNLQNRRHSADAVVLHTDGNRSGDKKTRDTTDNLRKFYRNTDIVED